MTSLPDWADPQLSRDLPVLRSRGENQEIEYMEVFPEQVRELAKEVAAFGSTNPGTILLGVSDPGDLVGLPGLETPSARDALLRRLEGICRGSVKPAITPTVKWAVENTRIVMVIQVPKGSQPVYYSNAIPYVRHLSESRPAEAHEVIERVRLWLSTQVDGEQESLVRVWLSEIASLVTEALVFGDEADDRDVNPWLDQWRSQYRHTASRLRELAADAIAAEQNLAEDLNLLADALDATASFRLYMGCTLDFDAVKQTSLNKLHEFKRRHLDPVPLSDASKMEVCNAVQKINRQLLGLAERMAAMINEGDIETVQVEASGYGFALLKLSYYGIDAVQPGLSDEIRAVGRQLHLVETMPLYLDGGASLNAVANRIHVASAELGRVASTL